jgi:hypothetical protein
MPQDVELTPEFFQHLAELEERPDTVVEKLQLSAVDLLRLKSVCEFSSDENEAYKALLRAAISKDRQAHRERREEFVSGFLDDTLKSVGAVAVVVIGGLSQVGRIFAKKQHTPEDYSISAQGGSGKASLRQFKERGLSQD